MKDKKQYIEDLVNKYLPDETYFVERVEVRGHDGKEKVVVLVDGDNGISVDVCSSISRRIAKDIEESEVFSGSYTLEVSSPGLDYPLQSVRQYEKNIGRTLKVKKTDSSTLKGELLKVDEVGITLKGEKSKKTAGEPQLIVFNEILKSNVVVTFK